jgi:short-subunit dehydrogenase
MKALITGGSAGLGRALSQSLLEDGYDVYVIDKDTPSCSEVHYIKCDLSLLEEQHIAALPIFDLIICNAGITTVGDFRATDEHLEQAIIDTNLVGHIKLIKYILKNDKVRVGGAIGFINSASVFVPWPAGLVYAATKSGLDGFAKALESFLITKKVTVSRVFPGPIKNTNHGGLAKKKNISIGASPDEIAPRIVRSIKKGKRIVFPDSKGAILSICAIIFPRLISIMIHRKLKSEIGF